MFLFCSEMLFVIVIWLCRLAAGKGAEFVIRSSVPPYNL
jgi:hypothetical protein